MKRFKVTVEIDRPKGYLDSFGNRYPLAYGYVKEIIAGDGEAQDAYILTKGTSPDKQFKGEVIAIILRADDIEDKWVVADAGAAYTEAEIWQEISFLERFFQSEIMLLSES